MAIWSRGKRGAADEPPTRVLGEPAEPPVPAAPVKAPAAPAAPTPAAPPVSSGFSAIDVSDEPETEDMEEGLFPLKSRSSGDEPKTQIFKSEDTAKGTSEASDPPAGFLIIVDGPGKGRFVSYGYGVNTIGRGEGQRVRLDFGDANISRENHAQIVFDPQSRKILLRHELGANLTYFKGEAVLTPAEIGPRESFRIADTTLMVLPLCDENWDWDNLADS